MNGTLGRDKLWNQQIWDDIDNTVRGEVGRIRVAQKVFPCTLLASGQQVPIDSLSAKDPSILQIEEGQTKPFVEIWVEFSLTQSQVDNEESLHSGRTLARMAANKIAAAEDTLLFQGKSKAVQALITLSAQLQGAQPLVKELNAESLGHGLLGKDGGEGARKSIQVAKQTLPGPIKQPSNLTQKVAEGIAELKKSQHYGPYALFLPPVQFAYVSSPLSGGTVTPADLINPLVAGGTYGTGCLPDDDGLLVSLGGEPTTIYMGIDATTAFTQVQPNGIYRFRVFERIHLVERDPKAFLRLKFV
jgi:uncharacterized linocin/CFP29 family protein